MQETVEWTWPVVLTLLALGGVTLLTRGFFLLPEREWPLPAWLRKGLRYAPLAALAAIVAPEVVLTQGEFVQTWRDARLFGALAAALCYATRRDVLLTLVVGMGVFLPLRLLLGW